VIVLLNLKAPGRLRWAVLETAINILIAICIARAVALAEGRTARLLNWRPLVFIGQMSYSLYLWQQPFLNRIWPSWPTTFPINLCLAAVAALLSYYLVEKPFLALREKLESRRLAASQPLAPAAET
jgi:peptidoglycan/LPS O-acetylase OafA/YrhL